MADDITMYLRELQRRVQNTQQALHELGVISKRSSVIPIATPGLPTAPSEQVKPSRNFEGNVIHTRLEEISQELANSYAQVNEDSTDSTRVSWAGTAHEIREVLRGVLEILAPDTEVMAQTGFKLEKDTKGPTHKQRAEYILKKRGASSREREMVSTIDTVDELVARLGRSIYVRASDAAHRLKGRAEALRLLRYCDAFMHDILELYE